jgi:hypothetical protein
LRLSPHELWDLMKHWRYLWWSSLSQTRLNVVQLRIREIEEPGIFSFREHHFAYGIVGRIVLIVLRIDVYKIDFALSWIFRHFAQDWIIDRMRRLIWESKWTIVTVIDQSPTIHPLREENPNRWIAEIRGTFWRVYVNFVAKGRPGDRLLEIFSLK